MTDSEVTVSMLDGMIEFYAECHAFVTEQSEGEWTDELIAKDARKLALLVARHRIAALEEVAAELDTALPDEIDLFRTLRQAGRKDIDKARAILALLPDPSRLRTTTTTKEGHDDE